MVRFLSFPSWALSLKANTPSWFPWVHCLVTRLGDRKDVWGAKILQRIFSVVSFFNSFVKSRPYVQFKALSTIHRLLDATLWDAAFKIFLPVWYSYKTLLMSWNILPRYRMLPLSPCLVWNVTYSVFSWLHRKRRKNTKSLNRYCELYSWSFSQIM